MLANQTMKRPNKHTCMPVFFRKKLALINNYGGFQCMETAGLQAVYHQILNT